MPESLSLGTDQFARMLDIVVAEHAALKRHLLWYRLQKAAFYLLALALAIALLGSFGETMEVSLGEFVFWSGVALAGIASLAIVPLFFINLPFAWKLLEHELLRRRLGLQEGLRDHLRAAVKDRWIMLMLSVVGLVAAVVANLYIAEMIEILSTAPLLDLLEALWVPIAIAVVGLSVPSLWLISRGVDRLEEVSRIRDRLRREVAPEGAESGRIEVATQDYDRIAWMEKVRVLDDRNRSVRKGSKLAKSSIYAVQRSLEAQAAIERLDSKARLQLEKTIFSLMDKPKPKQAREESPDRLLLPIPDSGLVLCYKVDDANNRIRIYDVCEEKNRRVGSEE